ncbi:OsmC family protein [Roseicella aquatilis]|uniref:OsmC family peroxiredoxin n=1 Tax=Roseicella aquatilis TaxID=2527868 RepID=A0A4R4DK49_9PROT|nr:OsmC family protein [Roseicella aquatilis]TCZ61105.1 OsmC family peroxiredoxin [Roseicella aquatilis]
MSALRTLRSRTVAGSRFRQFTHIRDLPVLIVDEPSGIADTEPAPEPLEVLLAALGSDLTIGIRAGALARGIALSGLTLDLEADIAAAPMDMAQPAPIGFTAVRVAVHIEADVPWEALATLVARATLRSPVANTLHDGTELNVALADAQGR